MLRLVRRVLPIVSLVSLLSLAACGGGASATPTPRPAFPTATPLPASTPTAAATTPATPVAATPVAVRPAATATPAAIPTSALAATATGPGPKRGGVLKQGDGVSGATASYSLQQGIRDPQIGPVHEIAGRLIFQMLFHYDPYQNNILTGLLVDKWQFNAAADLITIQLQKDARWSDGKPVMAQDVKFSMDAYGGPPKGYVVSGATVGIGRGIESVTVVDDKNLTIKLKVADVSFLAVLADPNTIIRPSYRTLEQTAREPIGSGPYTLKTIQTDVKFVFDKNANYWAKDAQGNALPYVDGIENVIIGNYAQAYAAVLTGQIDTLHARWGASVRGKEAEIQKRMPDAFLQVRFGSGSGWGFKNAAPFDNPQVWKALNILTDRVTAADLGGQGAVVIDVAGVLPGSSGNAWALPAKEVLSAPGFRYINKKTGELEADAFKLKGGSSALYEKDPKDIELGKQMLRSAGLDPDKGQFPKVTLLTDAQSESIATVLAGSLQKYLNTSVTLDVVDRTAAAERYRLGQFQGVVTTSYVLALEPSLTLQYFTTGNGGWAHGFQLPEMDDLHARQKRETDPLKRKDLVFEMQRKILAGIPVMNTNAFHGPSGIVRGWVKNFPVVVSSDANVYSLERFWLER